MKNLAPETIRLMQAALEARDALRRLALRITAAGEDPKLRAEALEAARRVALTHCDMLRLALKDTAARRHSRMAPEAQPLWALGRELRGR
jgi:hypothetical protein